MSQRARQLCRASNTVSTAAQTITVCPHCGRKVTPVSWVWMVKESQRRKYPIVPAHPRDEQGEVKVRISADKDRYPR